MGVWGWWSIAHWKFGLIIGWAVGVYGFVGLFGRVGLFGLVGGVVVGGWDFILLILDCILNWNRFAMVFK